MQTYRLCLKILFFAFPQVFCALRNEVKCFEFIRKTVVSPELRNENKTNKQKSQKLWVSYKLIKGKMQQTAQSLITTKGLQFLGFVEFKGPGSWMQAGENDCRRSVDTALNTSRTFSIWRKAVFLYAICSWDISALQNLNFRNMLIQMFKKSVVKVLRTLIYHFYLIYCLIKHIGLRFPCQIWYLGNQFDFPLQIPLSICPSFTLLHLLLSHTTKYCKNLVIITLGSLRGKY